jgi:hypothetical protein
MDQLGNNVDHHAAGAGAAALHAAGTNAATDLTPANSAVRRYVVQLDKSPTRFDPLAVPRLAVFDLYLLHCSVGLEDGIVQNRLRLGYFSEACGADVLAHYLGSYFESPQVVEIDPVAEGRAMPCRFLPLKEIGSSGQLAAVEVTSPRPTLAYVPELHQREAPGQVPAARSVWSRLLGRGVDIMRNGQPVPRGRYAPRSA